MSDTLRSMGKELEVEWTRLVAYVNDEVVPEVRRTSSIGLRTAAEQLSRFADELERGPRRHASAGSDGSPGAMPQAADR